MEHKIYPTSDGAVHYWIKKHEENKMWLVFLPGLSADHTLFEKQIEFFASEYNCFVWDAPAHGLSRPYPLTFSMEDMADILFEIFQKEQITVPILIGQSLGGYISQVFMARHPKTVSAFISVDSCSMSRKYYSRWELALLKRTKGMYLSIPWKLLLKWGIWGTATTEYGRKIMEKTWSVYNKREFCELADHGYRVFAEAVEAKESYDIPCPVLLLCGEKDAAGSAKRYNKEWNKQDGHPLIWLKAAGHNSNTDAPEAVNRHIKEFILSL